MRTATQIRARTAEKLTAMLSRPSLFGVDTTYEQAVRTCLDNLAFIDGREQELGECLRDLEGGGLWGALGTYGAIAGALGGELDHTDRLASIFVAVAASLGYLRPATELPAKEFAEACAVDWAKQAPVRRSELEHRLGPPSYRSAGRCPGVYSYAAGADRKWLHFDFAKTGEDPLLEFVRLPAARFADGVVDVRPRRPGSEGSAEEVYRRFCIETLSGDRDRIAPLIVHHPDPAALWQAAYPTEVAALLAEQYRTMDVMRTSPPPSIVFVSSEALPFPTPVVNDGSGWKVDSDTLLQFRARAR